ncbi:FlgD immunoglobulin-like domain containing protein, partial [candidate division KSB1 bacterium]
TDIHDAVEDIAYMDTLQVSYSYSDSLIYEIVTGPEWLELTGNTDFGLLTGTPENDDVGDSIHVVIVVKDLENQTDTLDTYFSVANVNDAPVITTTGFDTASIYVAFAQTIGAEEVDVGDTLVFKLTDGPSWLTIDSTTGFLSGTPVFGEEDTTLMSVIVTDLYGAADTLSGYFLTVPYISHYTYTRNTETSYSIVIDTVEYANLEPGDEVAVFDAGLVVGAAVYNGTFPMGITAWGDDAQTPEVDGYAAGNEMTFVLYDASLQQETSTIPAYIIGDGDFGTGSYAQLTLTAAVHTTQPILLKYGWNLISSYINPDDTDLETLLDGISDNLEIVKDDAGKFYVPDLIDKIYDWDISEAYMVYMNAPDTLNVSGLIIPLSTQIPLEMRWNYVPNYYTASTPVSTALASLGSDLEIVQNDEGDFYIPDVIDGIANLLPGEGYKMYLASHNTLVYGASGPLLAKTSPDPSLSGAVSGGELVLSNDAAQEGEPGEPGGEGGISDKITVDMTSVNSVETDTFYNPPSRTGDSYSIVINGAQIKGKNIAAGDEIAVFDVSTAGDTVIVGSTVYNGSFPADLSAWINNSQTDEYDGYTAGNTMMFRIYDSSADIEYFATAVYSQGDGTFGNGIYALISSMRTTGRYGHMIQSGENEQNQVTVQNDSSKVTLAFNNNNAVSIQFDSGNVAGATLMVTQMNTTSIADSVPAGQQFSNPVTYYNIEIEATGFTATLNFEYSDSVLNALGIDENNLGISYYDSLDSRGYIWHVCNAVVNTEDNIITVTTEHFSIWAVVDKTEEIITSVDNVNEFPDPDRVRMPDKVDLMQNYPNPFNPVTTIRYQIPAPADVTLRIYNISGQLVKTLVSGRMPAGYHNVRWDGTNRFGAKVGSGIYFYHLRAGRIFVVKKMVMIK